MERYPWFKRQVPILALLSLLVVVGISLTKEAMELEDAEQAYYSQWWRWGYDDQPPLYTWLQIGLNQLIGISKVSFSLLRGSIFASILFVLFALSKAYLQDKDKAVWTVLMLLCVPVFIDFTFRRLSHTALLCLVMLLTYCAVLRLIRKKDLLGYLLLGTILGIGILTKYNYALFMAALGFSALVDKGIREILWHRYIWITGGVLAVLTYPHLQWLVQNQNYVTELRESIVAKTGNTDPQGILFITPFISYSLTLLKLSGYLVGCTALLVALRKWRLKMGTRDWFYTLFVSQLTTLLLFFVVLHVQKVETRWLLPLFLPFMPLLARRIHIPDSKKWSAIGFYAFLAVLGLQLIRTPAEKVLGIPSDVHFGFSPISEKLRKDYDTMQWVLPDVTYGGNIRLLNPDREIFSMDDFSLPSEKMNFRKKVWIQMKAHKGNGKKYRPLDSLGAFGRKKQMLFFYAD
ncbi:MAG: glycosyltransferase family 39 protein [Bacteroidota bacterium]